MTLGVCQFTQEKFKHNLKKFHKDFCKRFVRHGELLPEARLCCGSKYTLKPQWFNTRNFYFLFTLYVQCCSYEKVKTALLRTVSRRCKLMGAQPPSGTTMATGGFRVCCDRGRDNVGHSYSSPDWK